MDGNLFLFVLIHLKPVRRKKAEAIQLQPLLII